MANNLECLSGNFKSTDSTCVNLHRSLSGVDLESSARTRSSLTATETNKCISDGLLPGCTIVDSSSQPLAASGDRNVGVSGGILNVDSGEMKKLAVQPENAFESGFPIEQPREQQSPADWLYSLAAEMLLTGWQNLKELLGDPEPTPPENSGNPFIPNPGGGGPGAGDSFIPNPGGGGPGAGDSFIPNPGGRGPGDSNAILPGPGGGGPGDGDAYLPNPGGRGPGGGAAEGIPIDSPPDDGGAMNTISPGDGPPRGRTGAKRPML